MFDGDRKPGRQALGSVRIIREALGIADKHLAKLEQRLRKVAWPETAVAEEELEQNARPPNPG